VKDNEERRINLSFKFWIVIITENELQDD